MIHDTILVIGIIILLMSCCLIVVADEIPIAMHQLIVVNTASDDVIRLKGYHSTDPTLQYKIIRKFK